MRLVLATVMSLGLVASVRAEPSGATAGKPRASVGVTWLGGLVGESTYDARALGGAIGLQLTPRTSLGLRAEYHQGEHGDPFEWGTFDVKVLRVTPVLRFDGRFVWVEGAAGYAFVRERYREGARVDPWGDEDRIALGVTTGVYLVPTTWPVRPSFDLGLALGPQVWISAGVSLTWRYAPAAP